jgi:hypothetical protein
MMSERDQQIIETFAARLRERFPNAEVWAFSSRERGDAQSHRLKLVKRQGYGRAGFTLVRQRVLQAA